MKSYSHRQSLWKHKQGCDRYTSTNSYNFNDSTVGEKRKSHEKSGAKRAANSEPLNEKKSKIQALANAIINDTPVKKMDHHSTKLPAADALRKSPPPVFQKLPSPPQEVVDDVFKVPRTKKDLIGYSDDDQENDSIDDKKSTDNSSESCSESDNNSSDGSTTGDKESIDNLSVVDDAAADDDDEDAEQPVIKYKFLPKTVKGLEKRFNTCFVEFTRHGKHEHRNELVALLDDMLRRNAIERNEYMKLNDLIASYLPTGESSDIDDTFIHLYKRFECEGKKEQKIDLVTMLDELKCQDGISKKHYDTLKKRIEWIDKNPFSVVKCITNEIIDSDIKELHKILTGIKVYYERIDRLEKLLQAGDYIDGEPSLPIVLKAIDDLDGVIPKSTIHRLKSLVNDLDKNKYRIVNIFNRLQNARDKEDEKNILKQLASEELLSAEQYNRLRSEEHTSELQSQSTISYAVFCLKKKKNKP